MVSVHIFLCRPVVDGRNKVLNKRDGKGLRHRLPQQVMLPHAVVVTVVRYLALQCVSCDRLVSTGSMQVVGTCSYCSLREMKHLQPAVMFYRSTKKCLCTVA
jgi:hypothetical protein